MYYINKRLLKFKIKSINYEKLIKNEKYFIKNKDILLINYVYNISNVNKTIIFTNKKFKNKWFTILTNLEIIDINANKDILWIQANDKKCKHCKELINPKKDFCNVTCMNRYKANNIDYRNKLSKSLKTYHEKLDIDKKQNIYSKVKKTLTEFNKKLTVNEKRDKYSNNVLIYDSYENLNNRFNNINFLFDKDFYYQNKFLPVSCKECGFKWEMTKTTNIARYVCSKCNPYKKHKTQTEIFDYILKHTNCKENCKNIISNELDIFCDGLNLAIEYNGLLSHSFGKSKVSYYNKFDINANYHLNKTQECENKGIQLFQIFEDEFFNKDKKEIWFSMINNKLKLNKKIPARKCEIRNVNFTDSKKFMDSNHLQGHTNSSINLGLYHNDELISLMTFRKHKKYQWEIARFCTLKGNNVIGGASKILKYFEINYKPSSILSFANRRWSNGKVYEKLGFKFIKNTKPNYFYFKENENKLYKREKFQKHKLNKILTEYNPNNSEIQNMINNNYRIIYDSGNMKFVKTYKSYID